METPIRSKTYSIRWWNVHRRDANSLTYRPSAITLIGRLAVLTLIAIFGAAVLYGIRTMTLSSDDLRLAQRVFGAVFAAGFLVSLLHVLSFCIEELCISCDARRSLLVQYRSLWPRTLVCPLSSEASLAVCARESLRRGRHGRTYSTGYTWSVTLTLPPIMQGLEAFCLDFQLDFQGGRPSNGAPLPDRVQEFVVAVSSIAQFRIDPKPTTIDARRMGEALAGLFGITIPSTQITHREAPIDELPEDVRAKVEAMLENARHKGLTGLSQKTVVHCEFKVMEKDGSVRIYHSLDELPPEVRATIERMRDHNDMR